MVSINNWIREDFSKHGVFNEGKEQLYYYKRKMEVKNGRIKSYYSHVFIYFPDTIVELEKEWENINNQIAFNIQSKNDALIEQSNFYLCIFIPSQIEQNMRTQIEADPYCSKKYIFEQGDMTIDECCMEVEKKVFSLSVNQDDEKKHAIKAIGLENFRAYDKENYIPLTYTESEVASLVVVFAKNGVGKTSIFDGVEYALTGKIGRIEELVSKSKENKMRGAILHHKKHEKEESKVILELDSGEKIERDVKKIRKGGNDYNDGELVDGSSIISNISQAWNQIILPHDKIDGFIMAKKPKERFKEWVSSVYIFDTEKEEFIKAHDNIKRIEVNIKESAKDIRDLKKKLSGMAFTKKSAELWYSLVEKFNQTQGLIIKYDKAKSDTEIYNTIINQANEYLRRIDTVELKEKEKNLSYINDILNEGIEKIKLNIAKKKKIDKEILETDVRLKRIKEYEAIIERRRENTLKVQQVTELLVPLQRIKEYGENAVLEKQKKYIENLTRNKEYRELYNHYKSEKIRLEEKKIELEFILDNIKKSLNSNEVDDKLRRLGNEADEDLLKRKEHEGNISQLSEIIEKVNLEYSELIKQKAQLEKSIIPEKIDLLNDEFIFYYQQVMGEEKTKEFLKLRDSYNENRKENAKYNKEIQKVEKENNELHELQKKALDYVSIHTDLCECPVCHSTYRDWSELFEKINEKVYRVNDSLKRSIEIVTRKNVEYINKFDDAYNQFEKRKELLLRENEKKLLLKSKEKKKYEELIYKEKTSLALLETNRRNRLQQLMQENISVQEFSFELAEKWLAERRDKLLQRKLEIENEIMSLNQKIEENKNSMSKFDEKIERLVEEKKEIVQDEKLFFCIEYLNNNIEFNIEEQSSKYVSMLEEYKDIDLSLHNSLNEYVDVIGIKSEDVNKQRKKLKEELETLKKWEKCFTMFPQFTEESVRALKEREEAEKKRLLVGREILEKIREEEGVQYFFKEYRQLELKIGKKERLLEKKKEEKNNAVVLYEEKKSILEEALSSYFSQECINEIYQKIDPHETMKNIAYKLNFNNKDEPELYLEVTEKKSKERYRPEWFFSTAQLNTVSFSSFFSRAIENNDLPLKTIFVDDPIGHFDDMNILGFADLIRSMLESSNCQIVMSTHDEKIFSILQRKLNPDYYRARFLCLPEEVKKLY